MRLYFDANSATEDGRYWLSVAGTLRDLERLGIELEPGMAVTLYMDDPDEDGRPALLLVDAVVEKHGDGFVARADERTWRHEKLEGGAVQQAGAAAERHTGSLEGLLAAVLRSRATLAFAAERYGR
jgi:hypothetical protein